MRNKALRSHLAAVVTAVFAALATLPAGAFAAGTADAKVKVEQAKALYLAADYEGAVILLEEAIALDPENGEALRYGGLCYVRLGDSDRGLKHLERAMTLLPEDQTLYEDAAWAAIGAARYDKGEEYAGKAIEQDPGSESARLLMAQALIGAGKHEESLAYLEPILGSEENGQAANYYYGISLIYMGRTGQSAGYFEKAHDADPNTELGMEALRYYEIVKTDMSVDDGGKSKYPFLIRGRLLYQYDTNVVPIHSSDFLPSEISDQEDPRFVTDLDTKVDVYKNGDYSAHIRNYNYASFQFRETEFNLFFTMLGGSVYKKDTYRDVPIRLGMGAYYSYAMQEGYFYNDNMRASPEILFAWNSRTNTKVVLDYAMENYNEPSDKDFDQDNTSYHLSISQNFLLKNGIINTWIGARTGHVWAEGDNYTRDSHSLVAGAITPFPYCGTMTAMVNWEERIYPDNEFDRHEKRWVGNLAIAVPIYKTIDLYTGVVYTNVDANVEILTYERWIYTAGLQATIR